MEMLESGKQSLSFTFTYIKVQGILRSPTFWLPEFTLIIRKGSGGRSPPVLSGGLEGSRQWGWELRGRSAAMNKWHFMFLNYLFVKVVKRSVT